MPFDVVVIGAGSAGCAVAAALAESGVRRIGLVEAGPDYGARAAGRWPAALLDPRRGPDTHDWNYEMDRGDGTTVPESRARVVSGCSAHNQCAIVRPGPDDCRGWGWTAAELAAVTRAVTQRVPAAPYADGELAVWQRTFLDAAVASGVRRVADVGDPAGPDGVAPFHANVVNGVRFNAAFAFLDRVRGTGAVTVLADTLVDRLELDRARAVAVHGVREGTPLVLRARRFVLCAGTYGSPAILLRSGVGPPRELRALGIAPTLVRPGVGRNLHDHPGVALEYEPRAASRRVWAAELAAGRFYESQVLLRARSRRAGGRADLHLAPYQSQDASGEWSFGMLVFALTPRSRGRLSLHGADPTQPPRIELGLLTDRAGHDVAVLLDGLRLARRVARAQPLAGFVARELTPGARTASVAALRRFIRAEVTNYSHPVGTCATGAADDPAAVVGPDGRVHGLRNVYAADASVLRRIPRANTNFSCFLSGWRAGMRLGRRR